MCGRYNVLPDLEAWLAILGPLRDVIGDPDFWKARYNITPGQWVPIIRATLGGDGLIVDKARWGFVPHWVREEKPKAQPINARDDGVTSKPYFRDSFKHRRCLFPASGFYEWQTVDGSKQPYNVGMADGSPFLMAGIWDNWKGDDTAAIITTSPNSLMVPIHDRMPVIVSPDDAHAWLFGEHPEQCLKPFAPGQMRAYRVGKAVNNPRNNSSDLLKSIEEN
jgi:putative SOS response-associated peptidase YedK